MINAAQKNITSPNNKPKSEEGFFKSLFLAIIFAVIIRSFLYEPFHIPSGSMKPNLLIGDYIFVSKYSYGYSKYSFPLSAPRMNYRCCDRFKFWPMVNEGREKSTRTIPNFEKMYGKMKFPARAVMELQWGYLGGVTFLDAMVRYHL